MDYIVNILETGSDWNTRDLPSNVPELIANGVSVPFASIDGPHEEEGSTMVFIEYSGSVNVDGTDKDLDIWIRVTDPQGSAEPGIAWVGNVEPEPGPQGPNL